MQRAARRVAQENERLRSLLARHGILKEEIDSFLRSCETTEGSIEPESQISGVRSPGVADPHAFTRGPRSIHMTPQSPAYPQEYNPRPSPISVNRPLVQISRRTCQPSGPVNQCVTARQCGPKAGIVTSAQVEAATMSRPVEACRQAESYYASPSETDSSPPRPQEDRSAYTYAKQAPAITQSQGCCPPPEPQPDVIAEDPGCPSTADCFCPPTATAPQASRSSSVSNDEISCETAATIIAQMRGDEDDAAARASIGCAPGQVCTIKNSFLMQVLDER